MEKIRINLRDRSYDIIIGTNLLKDSGYFLKRLNIGRNAVIVTNRRLLALYRKPLEASLAKASFMTRFELVPDSEKAKSARYALSLINRINAFVKEKEFFIIAFGGGVIGDLAGLVACLYKRGVPYVQFPTTLLAQVDSAIGGKVAIDLPTAKNLLGAFYQPRLVLSDLSMLKSLTVRQIRNGLSEIIKYAVIEDRRLFEFLERNYAKVPLLDAAALEYVVTGCARLKAKIVQKDEFDRKGIRIILNYGHTIGHALEAASSYSRRYNHGEAIAIGMVAAARISLRMGMIGKDYACRIENLIKEVGLPVAITRVDISSIEDAYIHDKKFIQGKNRLVLPTGIGTVKVVRDVPKAVIKDTLKSMMR